MNEDPFDAEWGEEFWAAEREAGEDIRAGRTSRVYDDTGAMFAGLEAGR